MGKAALNSFYNNRKIKSVDHEDFLKSLDNELFGISHASGASDDVVLVTKENFIDLLTKLNIKMRDWYYSRVELFLGEYASMSNLRFSLWLFMLYKAADFTANHGVCNKVAGLREKLVSLKSKNIFFNGIDQSCGLAELDGENDEILYIREWSEESRRVNDADTILKTIERLGVQNHINSTHTIERWLQDNPISELLTSGSLGLNGDNSEISREFKKYFNLLEDKEDLKINSKKALLLVPEDVLRKAIVQDCSNSRRVATYNVVSARDYNKTRYIVNSDIVTYFQMKYLFDTSMQTKTYHHGNMRLHLSSLLSNIETEQVYYRAIDVLKKDGVVAGMDYARFDFQPTYAEIKHVIVNFFDDDIVRDALLYCLENTTYLRNIRTGRKTKYMKGIMSGWFLTSWLDSIINICWFVAAMVKNNISDVCDFYVLGDDSLLISETMTYTQVDEVVLTLENDFGLNINVDKTEKGNGVSYLRHVITKTQVNGMPLRAVNALLTFNEKNASEYVAAHADDFAAIDTTFSSLNKLCSRLNCRFNKQMLYDDVRFNKNVKGPLSDKIHWLNGDRLYGGCGYPLGNRGSWNIRLEIIQWRGGSRGEAFAQGGIRYRKNPFIKVERKSAGKRCDYSIVDYDMTFTLHRHLLDLGYILSKGQSTRLSGYRENNDLMDLLLNTIATDLAVSKSKAMDIYRFDRNNVAKKLSEKLGLSKHKIKNVLDSSESDYVIGWSIVGLVDKAAKMVSDITKGLVQGRFHVTPYVYENVSTAFACKV